MSRLARLARLHGWFTPLAQRLFWLRWATIALVLGASMLEDQGTRLGVPMTVLALAFGLYNALAEVARRRAHASYALVALTDVPVVTALLALCGTPTCPLYVLFLLSALVAALSMETAPALLTATLLTLGYAGPSLASRDTAVVPGLVEEVVLRSLLLLVIALASVALVRQWTIERNRAQVASAAVHRLSLLNELVRMATAALDLDEVMNTVTHLTRQALAADTATVLLLEPARDAARQWSSRGSTSVRLPLDALGLPRQARDLRRPVLLPHVRAEVNGSAREATTRSAVLAPLLDGGKLLGVLTAYGRQRARFGQRELELLRAVSEHVVPAIRNAQRYGLEREHAQRLMELERARNDFLTSASHELRTPLTTIKLVSSLLSAKLEGVSEQDRSLLESLSRNTGRLERLVNELIDAAKLQSGALRLHEERLELRTLVREVVACARQRLQLGERALQVELPPAGPALVGDRPRLEQALLNLLEAAEARAPAGTPIAVRAWVEREELRLAIADGGPMPSADELQQLFVPFAQAARPEARPACGGLSLAVARMVVELHGGRLWAERGELKGLSFQLALSAAKAEAEEDRCAS